MHVKVWHHWRNPTTGFDLNLIFFFIFLFSPLSYMEHHAMSNTIFFLLCVILFPALLWNSLLDPGINSSLAFDRNFGEKGRLNQLPEEGTWRHRWKTVLHGILGKAQRCARGGLHLMWGTIFLPRTVKHWTGFLERWLMPETCHRLRGVWTVPLTIYFKSGSPLKWSGNCTRWLLQIPSDWNIPRY